MRPEWLQAYEEALHVRSTRVIHELVRKGGHSVVPLAACIVVLGVYPALVTSWMEPSVTGILEALASSRP